MSVAEEILKRKLKGFYNTLKAFGYLDKVVEAMEEYEENDRAKLHTMVVGPSSGKTAMYDAIAKYAGDKNIVVIGDLPMEMDPARVIEKINESHPELRASKEFKIEDLPELTMPFVSERDWNDNRPFYQKLDKNKKRKYGKKDDERFWNLMVFGAYGTNEEIGAIAPVLAIILIIVLILIAIFS